MEGLNQEAQLSALLSSNEAVEALKVALAFAGHEVVFDMPMSNMPHDAILESLGCGSIVGCSVNLGCGRRLHFTQVGPRGGEVEYRMTLVLLPEAQYREGNRVLYARIHAVVRQNAEPVAESLGRRTSERPIELSLSAALAMVG